jgi:hypothetical protein
LKVEIQGDNPEKIKALDIATIFYKAFINLTIEDIIAVSGDNDAFINPTCINNESDDVCSVSFKEDNIVSLIPIFIDTTELGPKQ